MKKRFSIILYCSDCNKLKTEFEYLQNYTFINIGCRSCNYKMKKVLVFPMTPGAFVWQGPLAVRFDIL